MTSQGGMARPSRSETPSGAVKWYLIAYNSVQLALYTAVFALSTLAVLTHPLQTAPLAAYTRAGPALFLAQRLALLELAHAALRLSNSPLRTALIQVLGRNLVLFGVLRPSPPAHASLAVLATFLAWSLAELTRYPLYLSKLLRPRSSADQQRGTVADNGVLTFLRYNAFLVLYPLGILGEIGIVLAALPYIRAHKLFQFSVALSAPLSNALATILERGGVETAPNSLSRLVLFDFEYFCYCGLASYVYFGPAMYLHMLRQRRKHYRAVRDEVQRKSE